MGQILESPGSRPAESLNIRYLINILKDNWWMFVISLILFFGIALYYTKSMSSAYVVSAKLLVDDAKKGGSNYDASEIFGDFTGQRNVKTNVDNEVEVLKTNFLAEKVVKNLQLNIVYYQKNNFKAEQIDYAPFIVTLIRSSDSLTYSYFKIVSQNLSTYQLSYTDYMVNDDFSKICKFGQPTYIKGVGLFQIDRYPGISFENKTEYTFEITSVYHAVNNLKNQLNIAVSNKLVTTVDLTLWHPLPQLGEEILSNLITCYIDQNNYNKNNIVDSTISFIENRILIVSQELGDIEGNIQNFKQQNKLADLTEQSRIMVTSSSQYENELSRLETEINIIDDLQKTLKGNEKNRSIPTSAITQDPAFTRLVEGYNSLLLERDKLLLTSTENNPYIKNLDERINAVRNSLLASLMSIKRSSEISYNQLKKKINTLGANIKNVPANERTYLGMFRQQNLKQELYLYLLKKREEIALSKTANFSKSKVIDPPRAVYKSTDRNKIAILLISLIIGLILPIGFIYLKENLNDKIKSKADIQSILELPVIGELGHASEKNLYVYNSPKSALSEQFRSLRTNLNFYLSNSDKHTILVTSSVQGEGKTFTALNMATVLATSGKKVLLMDLDLRKATLTDLLKLKNKEGFTDYTVSPLSDFSTSVHPSGINDNLFIVPSGNLPSNPSEVLLNQRTNDFITKAGKEFDYVVMLAPPLGLVTDANSLAEFATLTLYIVRSNFTLKSRLHTLKELKGKNIPGNACIIYNDVKVHSEKAYGYGKYGNS